MTPAEPPKGAKSRTPRLNARGSDLAHVAAAVEALFDALVALAENSDELQVQLGEFRDEHHPMLEVILRKNPRKAP